MCNDIKLNLFSFSEYLEVFHSPQGLGLPAGYRVVTGWLPAGYRVTGSLDADRPSAPPHLTPETGPERRLRAPPSPGGPAGPAARSAAPRPGCPPHSEPVLRTAAPGRSVTFTRSNSRPSRRQLRGVRALLLHNNLKLLWDGFRSRSR